MNPYTLHWYQDPIVISTIVIALATVLNVAVSYGLWRATKNSTDIARRAFESVNRPYIYLRGLGGSFNDRVMEISATVKNYSNVPANQVIVKWDVWSNEEPIHQEISDPFILEPNSQHNATCKVTGSYWLFIHSGKVFVEVEVEAKYKGPTQKEHYYRERYWYKPDGTVMKSKTESD